MAEQTQEDYLKQVNIGFRMNVRGLRAALLLAQMNGEILPDVAKALKEELMACALLMEQAAEVRQ